MQVNTIDDRASLCFAPHFAARSGTTDPAQDDAKHMVPVSINELLLRGCTLKNSGFILGLVIYTGAETRIQMNSTAPPRKQGANVDAGRVLHVSGLTDDRDGFKVARPRLMAKHAIQLRAQGDDILMSPLSALRCQKGCRVLSKRSADCRVRVCINLQFLAPV